MRECGNYNCISLPDTFKHNNQTLKLLVGFYMLPVPWLSRLATCEKYAEAACERVLNVFMNHRCIRKCRHKKYTPATPTRKEVRQTVRHKIFALNYEHHPPTLLLAAKIYVDAD